MTKTIFRIENRRQAESNQACLNCRGAKEEKSANAFLTMVKTVAILAAVTMFAACEPEEENNPTDPGTEQDADFVAFTFEGIDGAAVIDKDGRTVSAKAQQTVDLGDITAEFTLSTGATATVDGTPQVSGTTANDFNDPVIYEVTSGDGETTLDWTVTITGGKPDDVELSEDWDGTLILPDGEVWLKNTSSSNKGGYIFHSDGTYNDFNNYDGETFGEWVITTDNEYELSGNELTIYASTGAIWTYTYTISGNTLTLDFLGSKGTFTRTGGINPTDNVYQ